MPEIGLEERAGSAGDINPESVNKDYFSVCVKRKTTHFIKTIWLNHGALVGCFQR